MKFAKRSKQFDSIPRLNLIEILSENGQKILNSATYTSGNQKNKYFYIQGVPELSCHFASKFWILFELNKFQLLA